MKMKHLLMHPPRWLERILSRSSSYRGWYIKQVCHVLREDAMKSFAEDLKGFDA